jgi:uncharacterized repeat protein (TIGR03803 family)
VLHYFHKGINLDGFTPNAGLIVDGNNLYGTTAFGGAYGDGTVFVITTNGSACSVLHSFDTAAGEGKVPESEVVMAGDTLYGTTLGNGSGLAGTIFSVNTDGSSFTMLHDFPLNPAGTNSDGSEPFDRPVLSGNILYGTTTMGGLFGGGTIFSQPIVPSITSVDISGANVTLNAIEGMEDESFIVLASPSLSLPLSLWTPLATNTLAGGGNFTETLTNAFNPAAAQAFYTLQVTPP